MAYGEPITITLLVLAATAAAVSAGSGIARSEMEKSAARKRLESARVQEAYQIVTSRREQAAEAVYQQLAVQQAAGQQALRRERLFLLGSGLVAVLIAMLAVRRARRTRRKR